MRKSLFALACLVAFNDSFARCAGGYPNVSVGQERKQSDFVVIGKLSDVRLVVDPRDPVGYDALLFQVKISRVVSGSAPGYARNGYFTIFNENTSARFPIYQDDVGKEYLMFVRSGPDGHWLDSCGNSDELGRSDEKLKLVEGLVRAERPLGFLPSRE
jgi:hypothetical protein